MLDSARRRSLIRKYGRYRPDAAARYTDDTGRRREVRPDTFFRRLCPARGHGPDARRRQTLHRRGDEKGRYQSTNPAVAHAL